MTRRVERERKLLVTMLMVALLVSLEIILDCIIGGGIAYAAAQGALGASSVGSIIISVRKTASVGISGLRDMTANWTPGESDVLWSNDLCVFSNTASGKYTITASGARNANGAFVLSDGNNQLPYQVSWSDGGAGNLSDHGVALKPDTTSAPMDKGSGDSGNCGSGQNKANARLIISIPATTMKAVPEGNYRESLTLLVSPS